MPNCGKSFEVYPQKKYNIVIEIISVRLSNDLRKLFPYNFSEICSTYNFINYFII
jgi:hypothetical protein